MKETLQTRAVENFRYCRWGAERRVSRAQTRERGHPSALAELSDVLVNKPPKFSTKLIFKSNLLKKLPWCNPESFVGGVEVTEVLFDVSRLNLATVISAAQWGSQL